MANEGTQPSLGPAIDSLTEGRKVFGNRYTLIKIIGRGLHSVVWLALDEKQGRDVALKFLPEITRKDDLALAVLRREIRKLQEQKDPVLVPIYDVEADGNVVAIASEYVEGGSFADLRLQQKSKIFAPVELADGVRQLGRLLEKAHADGHLIHGSLTPANLLLSQKGVFRVSDFGLAKQVAEFVARTAEGRPTGRPSPYLSPQQNNGEPASFLDDIYSFGATIYELLTSKPPFHTGDIALQVAQKIPPPMVHRRKELRVIGEPVPRVWEECIAACLSKNPTARPQSMGQVLDQLGISMQTKVEAAPVAAPPPAKSKGMMIGVAAAAVVAIILLAVVLGKSSSGPAPAGGQTSEADLAKVRKEAEEKARKEADKIKLEADKIRLEADKKAKVAADEVARLKAEAEKARQEEIKRVAEAAKKAKEEEGKRIAMEQQTKKLAEELKLAQEKAGKEKSDASEMIRKQAEEKAKAAEAELAKLKADQEKAKQEETRRVAMLVQKAKEDEAKRIKAEEEARKMADVAYQARLASEKEAQRLAALAAQKKALEEKARADAEAKQMAMLTEKKKQEDEARRAAAELARRLVAGKPWENSLGMRFVPVGKISASIWETRVDDFDAFITARRYDAGTDWKNPGFKQGGSHPVVSVSWADARAFCKWLTEKEHGENLIDKAFYRLPTDAEWSQLVKLEGEGSGTPAEKDLRVKGAFPWGTAWPPPLGAGNYADTVSYDHFDETAPVGSFRPNPFGLYDLGGNAWEWCDDWNDATQKTRVLRGGSYAGYIPGSLFSSYRRAIAPNERRNDSGFRVILDTTGGR